MREDGRRSIEKGTHVTQHAADIPRRTGFALALNLAGIVVVGGYLLWWESGVVPVWAVVLGVVSLLAWLALLVLPTKWRVLTLTLMVAMSLVAAPGAWPSNGLLIVPTIAGILLMFGSPGVPIPLGYTTAVVTAVLVAGTPLALAAAGGEPPTVESIVSLEFAVLVAVLGGVNRRQARARDRAALQLAESAARVRDEQARASALAIRQSLARDMHDVLAHSLGGLVIQLDAVEAQLEAGQSDAALTRLHDARSMAASGLAEARRAVEALRADPDASSRVASADLAASLVELMDAHERLSGSVDFAQLGTPADVPARVATAFRRALQESLSNARKHAPGEPVRVRLDWTAGEVELEVVNAMPSGGAAATGGAATGGAAAGTAATGGVATGTAAAGGEATGTAATRVAAAATAVAAGGEATAGGAAATGGAAAMGGEAATDTEAVTGSAAATGGEAATGAATADRAEAAAGTEAGRPAALASTGGGHGLTGMRERFAELPGGAVAAGAVGGEFVVRVRAAIQGADGTRSSDGRDSDGRDSDGRDRDRSGRERRGGERGADDRSSDDRNGRERGGGDRSSADRNGRERGGDRGRDGGRRERSGDDRSIDRSRSTRGVDERSSDERSSDESSDERSIR